MAVDPDPARGYSPTEKVRIFESSCQIDFPSPDEQNFRIAMMKMFAREMGLQELKAMKMVGAGTGVARPPFANAGGVRK
jgi:hypothetical protein